MSFVGIYAKRGGISIHDAFKNMEDGGVYWVHDNEDRCFVLKDGTQTGEVDDARDVDWEKSTVRDDWKFLYRDPARDKALAPFEKEYARWEKVYENWSREHTKAERKAAYPKLLAAEKARTKAYIEWVIHPKRTPIALGIYGSS